MVGSPLRLAILALLLSGCGSSESPEPEPARPSTDPSVPFPKWQLPASAAEQPVGELPTTVADLEGIPGDQRCSEKLRTRLPILGDAGRLAVHTVDEALALPGSVVVAEGRHGGQRGLPLAEVLGDGLILDVWPCRGDLLRYPRDTLRADPLRFVLVKSGKGTLKLLDTHREGAAPVTKNLAALRLHGGGATSRSP